MPEEIVKQLSEIDIRASIVNATRGEIDRMPLPGLHEVLWESREYLGWRDPQSRHRGYLVHWTDGRPVGIVLRESDASLTRGISAMCALCRTAQPAHQVSMFTAPRAGEAGRNGNTIGTYICADLACSLLIRITPAAQPLHPDPAEIIADRAEGLLQRVQAFTADILRTA
jgi:hypothetical protein